MQIQRIVLNNYRGIPDFEVAVKRQGLFVGPNESGKTSVLLALDLLLGATFQRIYSTVTVDDFTDVEAPIAIEVDLGDLNDEELTAFPDEVDLTADPPAITYRLEVSCLDEMSGELNVKRWFPTSGHDRSATRDQTEMIDWTYVPASRNLARDLGAGRSGTLRRMLADLDLSDVSALETAMREVRDAIRSQASLEEFKTALVSALGDSLPAGGKPRVTVILQGDLEGNPLGSVDVALGRGGRSAALLHEQSDGIKALAAIAVYSMTVTDRGIVAIDEPETHLHPTAQRAVGRLLSEMSSQSLVATHSASIATVANPHDVIAFAPNGAPRTLDPTAPAVHPAFLARWWTTGLVDLLTSRRVAVVEGPADRIIVERAAEAHGVDLGRYGVAVLDLEGANNLKHALTVLGPGGFDIDHRALGDEDTRAKWARWVGEPDPTNLEDRGFVFSDADLEDEYVRAIGFRRIIHILASSGFVTTLQMRAATGVGSLAGMSKNDVVALCRKYKTEAAAAVALQADDQELRRIESVGNFIGRLTS